MIAIIVRGLHKFQMQQEPLNPAVNPAIPASAILAGIGALSRAELCGLVVMIESIGSLEVAKGAVLKAIEKSGLLSDRSAEDMERARRDLCGSVTPDAVLMHRLWFRLAEGLSVPDLPALSSPAAGKAASGLAVRASERLSPSVLARRRKLKAESRPAAKGLQGRLHDALLQGADFLAREDPLSFPDLVKEELLNLFADDAFHADARAKADPDIRKALDDAHGAALAAIAAGGGWAAFAAVVGNAGFLPYILAAQASAWIPLVGGPALVSLLATLINPATVLVGVAGLAWLGMGHGAGLLRSQVAARICVLLALQGVRLQNEGETRFLAGMRTLPEHRFGAIDNYLPKDRKTALLTHLDAVLGKHFDRTVAPAGAPPAPWNQSAADHSGVDAALTAGVTAGDMLWNAAAIDDRVLAAADFSRSAELGDPLSFAAQAQEFLVKGADVSLRGYSAEQMVLATLKASGHDVALAQASNTAGYDILLNSKPVQIKCGSDIGLLREHFERYPDIPVIANAELVAMAEGEPWADMVTTLPNLDLASVERLVSDALGHAIDLAAPSVVEFAVSLSLLRGGIEVAQGKLPVSDLPAWLVLDGATRGTLSFVGGKAGGWLGLVVIGPAGALVLGPTIACAALLGVGGAKGWTEKLLMRNWLTDTLALGATLHADIAASMTRRIDGLERVYASFAEKQDQDEMRGWMAARARDDLIATLEDRAGLGVPPTTPEGCMILLLKSAELAPGSAAVLRTAKQLQRQLARKPGLNDVLLAESAGAMQRWVKRFRGGGGSGA